MPRRPRRDKPGRLHHIVNRGQNRQRIFLRRRDCRFFLALLARAVRAGRIRVHAYCLMPNHFHLVLESVDGDISSTMKWIQGRYGGYFNKTREHTGHAFTGRFHSFPVTSSAYLWVLIRYIDRNPWVARRREDPILFAWGSARHHVRPGPRPRWLARNIIDRYVMPRVARGEIREDAYRAAFRLLPRDTSGRELVERRVRSVSRARDDLDALLVAGPAEVGAWLLRRSGAGSNPARIPLAMLDVESVRGALARERGDSAPFRLQTRRGQTRDPWPLVEVALLRDLAGLTHVSAAEVLGLSEGTARSRYVMHRAALQEGGAYLRLVASAAWRALQLAFGDDARAAIRAARLADRDAGPDAACSYE